MTSDPLESQKRYSLVRVKNQHGMRWMFWDSKTKSGVLFKKKAQWPFALAKLQMEKGPFCV